MLWDPAPSRASRSLDLSEATSGVGPGSSPEPPPAAILFTASTAFAAAFNPPAAFGFARPAATPKNPEGAHNPR